MSYGYAAQVPQKARMPGGYAPASFGSTYKPPVTFGVAPVPNSYMSSRVGPNYPGVPASSQGYASVAPSATLAAIPTQKCGYCTKDHVPHPTRAVSIPGAKRTYSTCSDSCHAQLLKSLLAQLRRPGHSSATVTATPSSVVAHTPPHVSQNHTHPIVNYNPSLSSNGFIGNTNSGLATGAPPPSASAVAATSSHPSAWNSTFTGQGSHFNYPLSNSVTPALGGPLAATSTAPSTLLSSHNPSWSQQTPSHHSFAPSHTPSIFPAKASAAPLSYFPNNYPTNIPSANAPSRYAPMAKYPTQPTGHVNYPAPQQQYYTSQQAPVTDISRDTQSSRHDSRQNTKSDKKRSRHDGHTTDDDKTGKKNKHESKKQKKREKRKDNSTHQYASSSGTYVSITPPSSNTAAPLLLQLQKWVDQRSNLPPFWKVSFIILDTNVLLDEKEPDVIFHLHHLSPDTKFIVPYVLVQELDNLKARASGPRAQARGAISRLFDSLVQGSKKDKWIRGQKPEERLPLEGALQTTSGDDRILECTHYFHKYAPTGHRVMLLTHDKNLQLKATMLGMTTGSVGQLRIFFDGYKWLQKERDILKAQLKAVALPAEMLPNIPDFRLEDYEPEQEEEEDEFAKVKAALDKAAKAAVEMEEKRKLAELDAMIKKDQREDLLARIPAGTKTNIYDSSSEEELASFPAASAMGISSAEGTTQNEASKAAIGSAIPMTKLEDAQGKEGQDAAEVAADGLGIDGRQQMEVKEVGKDKKNKKNKKDRKDKVEKKEKKRKRKSDDLTDKGTLPDEAAPEAKRPARPNPSIIVIED